MTYIRLDDSWIDHPKIAGLSDGAKVLYIAGLSYANRHLTDGALAGKVWKTIGGTPRTVQELVNGGLWHATDDGFAVHDYLKHQRSKAEIEADREKARERWKKGRSTRESRENFGRSSGEVRGSLPDSEVGRGRAEVVPPSGGSAPDGAGHGLAVAEREVLGDLRLRIGERKWREDPSIEADYVALLGAHGGAALRDIVRACDAAGEKPWPKQIRDRIRAAQPPPTPQRPPDPGRGMLSFEELREQSLRRAGMAP